LTVETVRRLVVLVAEERFAVRLVISKQLREFYVVR